LQNDEAELIRRAAKRDVAAWSALYERHYDDLHAYAYSRLGMREDAEDVTSQVFVEALRNIARLARQIDTNSGVARTRPLLAWLLGFERKLIAERMRQNARANRDLLYVLPAIDPGDTEPLLDRLDLIDALKHLTPEQQDVIILRFFMSKTTPEIAAIMEKKENAVFALQFRAVRALRRYLSDDVATHVFNAEAGS
jgi:RNA polymerase sigma-70 factor (ECF subfamily)